MIKLSHQDKQTLQYIHPEHHPPILQALRYGSALYVQLNDLPENLIPVTHKSLSSLEGVFRQDGCLIGVILWGNSGDGINIICPDQPDYAPAIRHILKAHL